MGAVQRINRNQIEKCEEKVEEDTQNQQLQQGMVHTHHPPDAEHRAEDSSGQQVRQRTPKRHEDIVTPRVPEEMRVDGDGLGPSEAHQQEQSAPDRIVMVQRVQ